jgi:hypothetical protein
MAPIQNPTYMLAPNWTFRPGGSIALGNIIVDPSKPHRVLTKPDPSKPPTSTETTTEDDWRLHLGKKRNLNLSLWAEFLQHIGFNIGTDHDQDKSTEYTMKSLETVYFADEPPIEEIQGRVEDPKVRKLMRLDSILSKPVYMITGLKIAKGFTLSVEQSSRHGGNIGGSAPVVAQVSIGAGVGGSVETSRSDGFQSANDIIFAYQLLKIVPKGFKEKSFEIKEHQSKATFLEDDHTTEEVKIEVEWSPAAGSDLVEMGKGRHVNGFKKLVFNDGKEEYECISFKDN